MALRPPAGILLATLGLAGALASPVVRAADSMAEVFDARLPNNLPFLNGGLVARAPYFHNGIAANLTRSEQIWSHS